MISSTRAGALRMSEGERKTASACAA